ncbi:hypothetical protein EKD04_017160 [Chloroflexales bacterium ZM16-3]|nr:hypothetical protein [Chloroflexales bacterium ZM16-3]
MTITSTTDLAALTLAARAQIVEVLKLDTGDYVADLFVEHQMTDCPSIMNTRAGSNLHVLFFVPSTHFYGY